VRLSDEQAQGSGTGQIDALHIDKLICVGLKDKTGEGFCNIMRALLLELPAGPCHNEADLHFSDPAS
jgi:hypothetical protein